MLQTINNFLSPVEIFIKKYRSSLGYFFIILSFFSLYYISSKSGEKESGEKALNVLWIILWLPILARVGGIKVAKALMPLRKELGILMGALAFVHSGIYIIPYWEELLTKGFWITDGFPSYLAVGFFALVLTIPLTLTSNNWSMKLLGKYWKFLHRSVYLLLILTVVHVVLLNWFLHFEVVPVVILVLYFIGKILEWNGISFEKKPIGVSIIKGQKWICPPCGYIYDPEIGDVDSGIKPGTEFGDIPDSWTCPLCGVKKTDFIPYNEDEEEATSIALVKETKMLNPTTIELVIETEENHTCKPGQFMSFLWKDTDGQFPRSYSIAKQEGKIFTFLIKLTKEGRGAKCIKELEVGSVIRIRSIGGRFFLSDSDNNKIFIATGTGLAPIFRMLLAEIEKQSNAKKSLYFSVSKKEDLFYVDNLKSIKNLDLHIHVTRENIEGYDFGRVEIDSIKADKNTEWYLCGNPKMVSETREKLMTLGYKNIFCEEF